MNDKKTIIRLAQEMFEFAKVVGQLVDDIAFTPYGRLKIHNMPRDEYYNNLRKFERAGLIKKSRKEYASGYVLTEKARQLRSKPLLRINREDGLSSIVMFDIPESKNKLRKIFRRYLLNNGYIQIQKSVFMGPFKISSELNDLVKELGIENSVTYFSGKIERIYLCKKMADRPQIYTSINTINVLRVCI